MMPDRDPRPLIAHVVFRFDVGGLENGVVNLINHLPRDAYRHAVISLTDITDFRRRVSRSDVRVHRAAKAAGSRLQALSAALQAVPRDAPGHRAHAQPRGARNGGAGVGRGRAGPHPRRARARHARPRTAPTASTSGCAELYRPFVTHYIALSRDLERYLCARRRRAGASAWRRSTTASMRCASGRPTDGRGAIEGCPFRDPRLWLVGTVGRMDPVKDPLNLVRAFIQALQLAPSKRARMRLLLVGDGALYSEARAMLAAGRRRRSRVASRRAQRRAGRPARPRLLRAAFAGRRHLQHDPRGDGDRAAGDRDRRRRQRRAGRRRDAPGELVPAGDPHALAQPMLAYARDPEAAQGRRAHGRARIEREFSLEAMVGRYRALYDRLLGADSPQRGPASREALATGMKPCAE